MSAIETLIWDYSQTRWDDELADEARAELKELLEYVEHNLGCRKRRTHEAECACGLDEFMKKFGKEG